MNKGKPVILQRRSEAEVRSLIIKAGRGTGLSLGHSIEMSDLTPKLMSDLELMFMIVDVLSEDHQQIKAEVSGKKILIKNAKFAMCGPILVDSLMSDFEEVILEELKWPALLRILLITSQEKYGVFFKIDEIDERHLSIKLSEKNFFSAVGPPLSIPVSVIKSLERMASKTYVPESDVSRLKGAGAGLTDND
ncbi:MAG: hypothetical protein ACJZ89_06405 [Paracoccaceae bacterium]